MGLMLVRHTTPDVEPGTCYGRLDLPVAATFAAEAAAVLAALPPVTLIVSSPLRRCRVLAQHIADIRGLTVELDERVQEMDFGAWEGLLWADIPRAELDAWADDFMHARPHGGESVAMLRERTVAALSDWRRRAQATAIITHSGVIKAALADGENPQDYATAKDFGAVTDVQDRF